jgi:cyanophycinase-like exopeptidase
MSNKSQIPQRTKIIIEVIIILLGMATLSLRISHVISIDLQEIARKDVYLMGSLNPSVYPDLLADVTENTTTQTIKILVLPIGLASDPNTIPERERNEVLKIAETERENIADACMNQVDENRSCQIILAPILVRNDTEIAAPQYFPLDLSAIFILESPDGHPNQVIQDTPIEDSILKAYQSGVIIAGGRTLSRTTIDGYHPGYSSSTSMNFGAIDLLTGEELTGDEAPWLQDAILETHFFETSRPSMLLNAITSMNVPNIGIGVDQSTGVKIVDRQKLENVFGDGIVTVFDASTYHSAETVEYRGSQHTLSLRNILVHVLSPGDSTYDLTKRHFDSFPPLEYIDHPYDGLSIPPSAGPLLISGKLDLKASGIPILVEFLNLTGGRNSKPLVMVFEKQNSKETSETIKQALADLGTNAEVDSVSGNITQTLVIPSDVSGIILLGSDANIIPISALNSVKEAWQKGMAVMATDAAASAIGAYWIADEINTTISKISTSKIFVFGATNIQPGVSLVNLIIEPDLIEENRWGRWIALAYNHPEMPAIGLNEDTGLLITHQGAYTIGSNTTFILDLRWATLGLGTNGGFTIANGLLDVFAPDEEVIPQIADQGSAPIRAETPLMPSSTPVQPTLTLTPTPNPTPVELIPTQTATETEPAFNIPPLPPPPLIIRPPAGNVLTNLMIALSITVVIIILFGLWVNRNRLG